MSQTTRIDSKEIMFENDYPRLMLSGLVPCTDGSFSATGTVSQDSRFKDGTIIHTSRVENIDFDEMELQTKNTIYKLI